MCSKPEGTGARSQAWPAAGSSARPQEGARTITLTINNEE